MEPITLTFGRYRGSTIEQLATIDPDYLQWMAREHISRDGVNFSREAAAFLQTHPVKELEVCPICENTSCGGPSEHQPHRRATLPPRVAQKMQAERTREIDYRYVRFNLTTPEGQQGYVAYLQEHPCNPQFYGSDLEFHQRGDIFDEQHYWIAEAIVRKVLGLGAPGPWKPGDRRGRPDHVELFI